MRDLPAHREALARAVREIRDERDISGAELASRASLDEDALAAIESGESGADFAALVSFARALDVPLSALADRYEATLAQLASD